MFAEMLIKRLPLLIHVFAISLAAFLAKTRSFKLNLHLVVMGALTMFSTICVLTRYAPEIKAAVYQGMGYGIGFNMVGGGENREVGTGRCDDCKNPYSNEELKKTVQRHTASLPVVVKAVAPIPKFMMAPPQEPEPNKDLPSGPGHSIIKKPQEIAVKKVSEPGSLCIILEKAGYNPQWTYEDIQRMYQTPEGKKLLQDIDTKVRQQSGMPLLTIANLNECYPHFYQTYSCVRNSGASSGKSLKNAVQGTNVQDNVQELATSCHWPSLVKELNDNITEQFNQQMAKAKAESAKQKLLSTLQYLRNRSELEIRNLINLFQSRSRAEWTRFYVEGKTNESRGYHIKGTTYYIPWSLLERYTLCFGITGNEA